MVCQIQEIQAVFVNVQQRNETEYVG